MIEKLWETLSGHVLVILSSPYLGGFDSITFFAEKKQTKILL